LVDGVSFGPEALTTIGQALDAAWDEIADDPADIETARLKLANAVLSA
jgi:hypothetical protein